MKNIRNIKLSDNNNRTLLDIIAVVSRLGTVDWWLLIRIRVNRIVLILHDRLVVSLDRWSVIVGIILIGVVGRIDRLAIGRTVWVSDNDHSVTIISGSIDLRLVGHSPGFPIPVDKKSNESKHKKASNRHYDRHNDDGRVAGGRNGIRIVIVIVLTVYGICGAVSPVVATACPAVLGVTVRVVTHFGFRI